MFDLLCFMKSIAASPARTMNNTDPKVETMMISQDVSPKITHKPLKKRIIYLKNHKASDLDDYYTRHIIILAGQVKENTPVYVNIISVTVYAKHSNIYYPCGQNQIRSIVGNEV